MQIQVDSQTLDVSTLSGTVIQVGKRDRVTVHSTGGGGSVGPHGGSVAPPQVYSRNTPITELWVRTMEGVEKQYTFHVDLPVREGHEVTVACTTPNKIHLLLVNHTTREWRLLNHLRGVASSESLSGTLSARLSNHLGRLWASTIFAGAVLCPLAADKDEDPEWWALAIVGAVVAAFVGGAACVAVGVVLEFTNRRAHRRMGDKLEGPVQEVAEELLRSAPVASRTPSHTS